MATNRLVLGVDLGTTATKVVAATENGVVLHETEHGYPLRNGESGEAVQDADQVLRAVMGSLAECARWVNENNHAVEAVSFSAAMHNVLGLDRSGKPVTPVFTWADTRSVEVVKRLRAEPEKAAELHRATGTPVHTQSVMVKLAWLSEERADLARDVDRWCALKDYVLAAFSGEFVTDHSLASGSGLQEMRNLRWHEPALQVAGVTADQLPEPRSPLDTFPLAAAVAEAVGLPERLPVVLGGGDGPLANLGVGAMGKGVAALSLGTSGALRVVRDQPCVDERCRTFCYALADGLWVIGGAVSNGAVVAEWAADTFGIEVPDLLDEALHVPPGANGLMALPYLLGERAPWWEPGLTASLLGLRKDHGRAEITRALVEGVAMQLALVRDAMHDGGAEVRSVRATGGGFRSQVWADAIAGALDTPLELAEASAGSGLGAALVGWRALGTIESLEQAGRLIPVERTVTPDTKVTSVLKERLLIVERLHKVLRDLPCLR